MQSNLLNTGNLSLLRGAQPTVGAAALDLAAVGTGVITESAQSVASFINSHQPKPADGTSPEAFQQLRGLWNQISSDARVRGFFQAFGDAYAREANTLAAKHQIHQTRMEGLSKARTQILTQCDQNIDEQERRRLEALEQEMRAEQEQMERERREAEERMRFIRQTLQCYNCHLESERVRHQGSRTTRRNEYARPDAMETSPAPWADRNVQLNFWGFTPGARTVSRVQTAGADPSMIEVTLTDRRTGAVQSEQISRADAVRRFGNNALLRPVDAPMVSTDSPGDSPQQRTSSPMGIPAMGVEYAFGLPQERRTQLLG